MLRGLGCPHVLPVRWLSGWLLGRQVWWFGEVSSIGQDLQHALALEWGTFLGQVPCVSKDWEFHCVGLCVGNTCVVMSVLGSPHSVGLEHWSGPS